LRNENFVGVPIIKIKNEIEEGDKVAVEGDVQCQMKNGNLFDAVFFDFYRLQDGKIKEMRSYVIEKK
jgi:ketosteroid isomerase-like protein